MTWISSEQLSKELQKKLKRIYVLFGDSSCFLQESYLSLIKRAKISGFKECINIELNAYTDWSYVFNICRAPSLFERRRILSLFFGQNYSISYFKKNMISLSSLLHNDLILIISIYRSQKIKKSDIFNLFYCFNDSGVFIDCVTPEYIQLKAWIINQTQEMKLTIENLACQLLCYYYENNFILLKQILQHLFLIYPDGNLSFARVKRIIIDSAYFNVNHWIEAILIGNKVRANRILKQLEFINTDLEVLFKRIQIEVLILIKIKCNLMYTKSLLTILKQYRIDNTYYYRVLLSRAVKRLQLFQLYKALQLLVKMELQNKISYIRISRLNLELLIDILCVSHKNNLII